MKQIHVILILGGFAAAVLFLGFLSIGAFAADTATPEVAAAETWLDANVPTIKRLQKELDALRADKEKRVAVLAAFGYSYNWDELSLVAVPKE